MIIGASGFGFAEIPIFIVFWGCAFLGQVVKKGNLGHPTKKEKFD